MGSRYQGSQKEVRALCAFINLMRASESISARIQKHLLAEKLTLGQFGVLEALFHCGPLCQCALGDKLLKSGANITMVIDNLEKADLVGRRRSVEDRRFITVALTSKGRRFIARIFPVHARVIVGEFEILSAPEQNQLRRLCRKLGKGKEGNCHAANH